MKNQPSLSFSCHDLHQWIYENRWTDDTCQWPIKSYDTGLAEERFTFWRHRKSIYKYDVRPRGRTLTEYSKVPIDQSADPWLATGSRAPAQPIPATVARHVVDSEKKKERDKKINNNEEMKQIESKLRKNLKRMETRY